jgi:hypothetical protein
LVGTIFVYFKIKTASFENYKSNEEKNRILENLEQIIAF